MEMDCVLVSDERDTPERVTSWLEFLIAPERLSAFLQDLHDGRALNPSAPTLILAFLDASASKTPLTTPLLPIPAAVQVIDALCLTVSMLEDSLGRKDLWRLANAIQTYATPDSVRASKHSLFWESFVSRVVVHAAFLVDPIPSFGTGKQVEKDDEKQQSSNNTFVSFNVPLPVDAPAPESAAKKLAELLVREENKSDIESRAFCGAVRY